MAGGIPIQFDNAVVGRTEMQIRQISQLDLQPIDCRSLRGR